MAGSIWEVVGGRDKGGIIVRATRDLKSAGDAARLSTGALVEELQLVEERLQYRRLTGTGPVTGWVSRAAAGKELLAKRGTPGPVPAERVDAACERESGLELRAAEERIGAVRAVVRRRGEGEGRAPCAVVLCPGNPGREFGSAHAGSPLILAIDDAVAGAGIPVVRFDYSGIGMSSPKGSGSPDDWSMWGQEHNHPQDVSRVIAWAREHLSDNVVTCGYSYGSAMSMDAGLSGEAYAFMAVSMGYNVWMYQPPGPIQDATKADVERHQLLRCPTLYVVGKKDRMTPMADLNRLIQARPDGGQGVSLQLIAQTVKPGEAHAITGQEDEAGRLCAEWLAGLRREILERDLRMAEVLGSGPA